MNDNRKVTRLKKLRIAAVDLVDRGAQGPHATVRLMKRDEQDGEQQMDALLKTDSLRRFRTSEEVWQTVVKAGELVASRDREVTTAQAIERVKQTPAGQAYVERYEHLLKAEQAAASEEGQAQAQLLATALQGALDHGVLADAPPEVVSIGRRLVAFLAQLDVASADGSVAKADDGVDPISKAALQRYPGLSEPQAVTKFLGTPEGAQMYAASLAD